MPSLLEACKKYFGSENLYDVLSIEKSATDEDIKKAYRRLSLKVHPDRVGDDEKEEATEKFKTLSKIHATLSDKDRRTIYDQTGNVDDDDGPGMDRDWTEYWRVVFKKITDEDIRNYEAKYRGGDEEFSDLKSAYVKAEGDLDFIIDLVPFSHPDDIPRFQKTLLPLIESGELPSFDCFLNEPEKKKAARKRKYEKEAKLVEIMQKREQRRSSRRAAKSDADADDVEASALNAIMKRKKEREENADAFFKHLEEKYANPKKGKKNKK
ncbi:DnaJ domain [Nesidiocoris tenuis]|uniref:DnaJ domain n=1 Tax=Nesidiocoris tenuis TaxID=355587 RepID=A0ABN7BDN1_9HEMI|nr:DnaJ domain [Nesidiocoris tenuis]